MNIQEAARLSHKTGKPMTRGSFAFPVTITPTNSPECCIINRKSDPLAHAPRWNPNLDDLTSDDWCVPGAHDVDQNKETAEKPDAVPTIELPPELMNAFKRIAELLILFAKDFHIEPVGDCSPQMMKELIQEAKEALKPRSAEPKAEKRREIVINMQLDGKDQMVQDLNVIRDRLVDLDQMMETVLTKHSKVRIRTSPSELMHAQLAQLRAKSAPSQSVEDIVAISGAMTGVFRALTEFTLQDYISQVRDVLDDLSEFVSGLTGGQEDAHESDEA